jgi:hypothetical protein
LLKNILKIVFLGVVGFGLLVYFTADKPKNIDKTLVSNSELTLDNIPKSFELVGSKDLVSSDNLFKEGEKTLLIVGNHDSLSVVKDLKNYFEINMPYVMVANISNAPWFIKKWAIPGKLEELNKDSNVPMIYDYDGSMVNSLNQLDTTKIAYFAYMIDENGNISNIYNGKVKEDAMDGSMSEEEKKASLEPLVSLLN